MASPKFEPCQKGHQGSDSTRCQKRQWSLGVGNRWAIGNQSPGQMTPSLQNQPSQMLRQHSRGCNSKTAEKAPRDAHRSIPTRRDGGGAFLGHCAHQMHHMETGKQCKCNHWPFQTVLCCNAVRKRAKNRCRSCAWRRSF